MASCYVEVASIAGMRRESSVEVWARCKGNGTDLKEISSLAKQRTFVQNFDNERTSDVPKGVDDEEDI